MTTLVFPEYRPDGSAGSATPSLREWLGARWAILFSHPGDFDREQLERDRWLSVVSRSFREHGVRPLALARCGYNAPAASLGWLAELSDDCSALLSTAAPVGGALLDFRVSALRAQIARGGARFTMIIDSDLRCRRMTRYRVPVDLPSPIELVGWAVALRDRQIAVLSPKLSACGVRSDSACSRRVWRLHRSGAASKRHERIAKRDTMK
ncbi:MAG TPA: hypothetical protein VHV80_11500 [Steroidobacteraceae bacterium]|jgi:hypothetical protein|nr:hypothetical protein [Steroidobacteraceae bacterium]